MKNFIDQIQEAILDVKADIALAEMLDDLPDEYEYLEGDWEDPARDIYGNIIGGSDAIFLKKDKLKKYFDSFKDGSFWNGIK